MARFEHGFHTLSGDGTSTDFYLCITVTENVPDSAQEPLEQFRALLQSYGYTIVGSIPYSQEVHKSVRPVTLMERRDNKWLEHLQARKNFTKMVHALVAP